MQPSCGEVGFPHVQQSKDDVENTFDGCVSNIEYIIPRYAPIKFDPFFSSMIHLLCTSLLYALILLYVSVLQEYFSLPSENLPSFLNL